MSYLCRAVKALCLLVFSVSIGALDTPSFAAEAKPMTVNPQPIKHVDTAKSPKKEKGETPKDTAPSEKPVEEKQVEGANEPSETTSPSIAPQGAESDVKATEFLGTTSIDESTVTGDAGYKQTLRGYFLEAGAKTSDKSLKVDLGLILFAQRLSGTSSSPNRKGDLQIDDTAGGLELAGPLPQGILISGRWLIHDLKYRGSALDHGYGFFWNEYSLSVGRIVQKIDLRLSWAPGIGQLIGAEQNATPIENAIPTKWTIFGETTSYEPVVGIAEIGLILGKELNSSAINNWKNAMSFSVGARRTLAKIRKISGRLDYQTALFRSLNGNTAAKLGGTGMSVAFSQAVRKSLELGLKFKYFSGSDGVDDGGRAWNLARQESTIAATVVHAF
jgi:hypothetical protein